MKTNSKKTVGATQTVMFALVLLLSASSAFGQKGMYEPKKGSLERSALIDTIIKYDVGRNDDLKGEKFDVTAIRVHANWAFVSVERSNLPEAGEGTHLTFLRKSGALWKVMWSNYNDNTDEVGVDALKRLRKKHKDFYKDLAAFAENGYLAG